MPIQTISTDRDSWACQCCDCSVLVLWSLWISRILCNGRQGLGRQPCQELRLVVLDKAERRWQQDLGCQRLLVLPATAWTIISRSPTVFALPPKTQWLQSARFEMSLGFWISIATDSSKDPPKINFGKSLCHHYYTLPERPSVRRSLVFRFRWAVTCPF